MASEPSPVMMRAVTARVRMSTSWGPLMAGYAIASVPLLVLVSFTMRWFVEGIATGAIKA